MHVTEPIQPTSEEFIKLYNAIPSTFRGELSLIIEPQYLLDAIRKLHNEYQFEALTSQTAVDYWPQSEPRFHVIYHFYSFGANCRLSLRVPLPGIAPSLPSIEDIYPNSNWFEREIWDMFGIHFTNHPDLRRILMPFDWEGHPLRKNYPLAYEEVQFSFNYDEINKRKPFAKKNDGK